MHPKLKRIYKYIVLDSLSYKTKSLNKSTVEKGWVVIDAEAQILGRLSSKVAFHLRGKHKPGFTPHVDCGDNVIVINCEKIKLTGSKMTSKVYLSHTGFPGGQRSTTPRRLLEKDSRRIIEHAVKGMLPKNKLGRAIYKNLYVYEGNEHPHAAQNPVELKLS